MRLSDGRVLRRHLDHIRLRQSTEESSDIPSTDISHTRDEVSMQDSLPVPPSIIQPSAVSSSSAPELELEDISLSEPIKPVSPEIVTTNKTVPELQRSNRKIQAPVRLDL